MSLAQENRAASHRFRWQCLSRARNNDVDQRISATVRMDLAAGQTADCENFLKIAENNVDRLKLLVDVY